MFRQNLPCQTLGLTEMSATLQFCGLESRVLRFHSYSSVCCKFWGGVLLQEVWAGCCEDSDPAIVVAPLSVLSAGCVQTSDEQRGRGSPDAGSGCQLGCSLGSCPALQPRVVTPVISARAQWFLDKLPLCRWDPVTELKWSCQILGGKPQSCWVWAWRQSPCSKWTRTNTDPHPQASWMTDLFQCGKVRVQPK